MQSAVPRLEARARELLGPLQSMLGAAHGMNDSARPALVNQPFNLRITFRPHIEPWRREDHGVRMAPWREAGRRLRAEGFP